MNRREVMACVRKIREITEKCRAGFCEVTNGVCDSCQVETQLNKAYDLMADLILPNGNKTQFEGGIKTSDNKEMVMINSAAVVIHNSISKETQTQVVEYHWV